MKKTILTLLALLLSFPGFAQEEVDSDDTLRKDIMKTIATFLSNQDTCEIIVVENVDAFTLEDGKKDTIKIYCNGYTEPVFKGDLASNDVVQNERHFIYQATIHHKDLLKDLQNVKGINIQGTNTLTFPLEYPVFPKYLFTTALKRQKYKRCPDTSSAEIDKQKMKLSPNRIYDRSLIYKEQHMHVYSLEK